MADAFVTNGFSLFESIRIDQILVQFLSADSPFVYALKIIKYMPCILLFRYFLQFFFALRTLSPARRGAAYSLRGGNSSYIIRCHIEQRCRLYSPPLYVFINIEQYIDVFSSLFSVYNDIKQTLIDSRLYIHIYAIRIHFM